MNQPTWIGQTIGGRYKIEALLGQGGMSAVYRGSDPNLQRTVAIKLIHPHLSSDPDFVRRFEQEAAAVAQLRHPNIIQVYDFDRDGDVFYMVLEYLPGETLQTMLRTLHTSGQRLPIADSMRIMTTICDAVAYAHQRGMIHRDLKPANVMIRSDGGQPILMDFGVAKIRGREQHTATGTIIGTVTYMSPEQARGDRLDERADLYSLGVILYEMIAGRPPFEGDSVTTVILKHLNEPPPDIRLLNKDVPDALVAILQKALAKNPDDRFQSASEMAAALREASTAVPTLVQPPATAATPVSAPTKEVTPSPAGATMVGEKPQTSAPTAVGAQRKRGPLPLALIAGGLGALALCVVALVLVVPQSQFGTLFAGGKSTSTEPAATATSVAVVKVSPTPAPTDTEAPPTNTAIPPTQTRPTNTPPPTATPTPIPLPEGMVLIPGGTFRMGSDEGQADEKPVHPVTLKAFLIDQYEVTNARYKKCVDEGKCTPPAITTSSTRAAYFGNPEFDNYPVIKVTWRQAAAFCEWEGKRLPTEAEWEYAATGGDGRRYPWGNDFDPSRVPVSENDTIEVGTLDNASPFGVFDMAGNVVEWVADRYGAYGPDSVENPTGPEVGSQQVMRGGSFGSPDGRFYTTTRRYHQGPGFHDVDIGFRCAADAP